MKTAFGKFATVSLIFALAFAAVFSATMPAKANSAQTRWEGTTSTGITISGNGDSPIVVDSELLTFDITNEVGPYSSEDRPLNTVTARYTFRNPTDSEITVFAVFPFMDGRNGYDYGSISDGKFYDITVDGVSANSTVRATYYNRDDEFDLEKEISNVTDEYKTADDWNLSEKVYRYKLQIDNDFSGKMPDYSSAYVTFSLPNVKMFCSENVSARNEYYLGNNSYISISYNEATQFIEFYTVGEPMDIEQIAGGAKFASYNYSDRVFKPLGGYSVKVAEQNELTFEDLVYLYHTEDSKISRLDWHNIVFEKYNSQSSHYGNSLSVFNVSSYEIRRWYGYEMKFAPHQTLVNEVKSPLFPGIDKGYEPTVYTYNYLLSPASTWASFKDLTIVVNTPFHILDLKDGWQKTETGYTAHYDTLPEYGELKLQICSSDSPKRVKNIYYAIFMVFIIGGIIAAFLLGIPVLGFVIFLIIFTIKALKNKTTHKKTLDEVAAVPRGDEPNFSVRPDDE